MSNNSPPTVFCFRNDLRLRDNPGLVAALNRGRPVVAAYVYDDSGTHFRALGAASRWWLHQSLRSLQSELERRGGRLVLRCGDWVETALAPPGDNHI